MKTTAPRYGPALVALSAAARRDPFDGYIGHQAAASVAKINQAAAGH